MSFSRHFKVNDFLQKHYFQQNIAIRCQFRCKIDRSSFASVLTLSLLSFGRDWFICTAGNSMSSVKRQSHKNLAERKTLRGKKTRASLTIIEEIKIINQYIPLFTMKKESFHQRSTCFFSFQMSHIQVSQSEK